MSSCSIDMMSVLSRRPKSAGPLRAERHKRQAWTTNEETLSTLVSPCHSPVSRGKKQRRRTNPLKVGGMRQFAHPRPVCYGCIDACKHLPQLNQRVRAAEAARLAGRWTCCSRDPPGWLEWSNKQGTAAVKSELAELLEARAQNGKLASRHAQQKAIDPADDAAAAVATASGQEAIREGSLAEFAARALRAEAQIATLEHQYANLHSLPPHPAASTEHRVNSPSPHLRPSSCGESSNINAPPSYLGGRHEDSYQHRVVSPHVVTGRQETPPPPGGYWWATSRATGLLHRAARTIQAGRRATLGRREMRKRFTARDELQTALSAAACHDRVTRAEQDTIRRREAAVDLRISHRISKEDAAREAEQEARRSKTKKQDEALGKLAADTIAALEARAAAAEARAALESQTAARAVAALEAKLRVVEARSSSQSRTAAASILTLEANLAAAVEGQLALSVAMAGPSVAKSEAELEVRLAAIEAEAEAAQRKLTAVEAQAASAACESQRTVSGLQAQVAALEAESASGVDFAAEAVTELEVKVAEVESVQAAEAASTIAALEARLFVVEAEGKAEGEAWRGEKARLEGEIQRGREAGKSEEASEQVLAGLERQVRELRATLAGSHAASVAASDEAKATLEIRQVDWKREKEELEGKQAELQSGLEDTASQAAALTAQLEASVAEATALDAALQKAKQQVTCQEDREKANEASIEAMVKNVEALQRQLTEVEAEKQALKAAEGGKEPGEVSSYQSLDIAVPSWEEMQMASPTGSEMEKPPDGEASPPVVPSWEEMEAMLNSPKGLLRSTSPVGQRPPPGLKAAAAAAPRVPLGSPGVLNGGL